MHQPKDAYAGPNHAVLNLVHDGMAYDRGEALVGQLAVYHTNDPAGWRPAQIYFDLWHNGQLNNGPEDPLRFMS